MSKYKPLWEYVKQSGEQKLVLSFEEIEKILGFKIDHSFLKYKEELAGFGYKVSKISLKKEQVIFEKIV